MKAVNNFVQTFFSGAVFTDIDQIIQFQTLHLLYTEVGPYQVHAVKTKRILDHETIPLLMHDAISNQCWETRLAN